MKTNFFHIALSLSLFYFSNNFIDVTTYPKLLMLFLFFASYAFVNYHKFRFKLLLGVTVLFWSISLLLQINMYGINNITNLLIGYPQRNLGFISFLIIILSFWIFANLGADNLWISLRLVGLGISIAIVVSFVLRGDYFTFDQFFYGSPGSLNSNVVLPVLIFGLVSWVTQPTQKNRSLSQNNRRLFFETFARILLIGAIIILGNLQSIIYLFIISVGYLLLRLDNQASKRLLLFAPAIAVILYVSVSAFFRSKVLALGDSSIKERLAILEFFWSFISSKPFLFRMIDSSADLNFSERYNPGLIIDNGHNVFLEIGAHVGWVVMLAVLVLLTIFVYMSTNLLLNDSIKNEFEMKHRHFLSLSLLVGFIMMFFIILSPISVWIYGALAGVGIRIHSQKILESKTSTRGQRWSQRVGFLRVDKMLRVQKIEKINFAFKIVGGSLTLGVLVSSLVIISGDALRKFEFRKIEREVSMGKEDVDEGVERLVRLAIETRDREYLDYSGRRLLEAYRCEDVDRILEVQRELGLLDQRHRILEEFSVQRCERVEKVR